MLQVFLNKRDASLIMFDDFKCIYGKLQEYEIKQLDARLSHHVDSFLSSFELWEEVNIL